MSLAYRCNSILLVPLVFPSFIISYFHFQLFSRKINKLLVFLVIALMVTSAQAREYDLAYDGAVETINGATFQQWDEPKPMGSGVIDAFVEIQGDTGESQHGYNTNGAREFDTKPGCRTLLLSDIPTFEFGGTNYREFLLDINQNVTSTLLSIDKIHIFLETTDTLSGYPGVFSTAIYDLDAGEDNYVKLDDSFGAGSGKGDMLLFVPDSAFTGAANYNPAGNNYIYLYSMFGATIDGSNGFEEWAIGSGGPIIPEPTTICLLGLGALGLLRTRKIV